VFQGFVDSQGISGSGSHVFLRWGTIYSKWECKQPEKQILVFWKSSWNSFVWP